LFTELEKAAYSGEVDQGSGVMPISVPVDSDQVIGAERRWQSDCVGSDRNRQEEVGRERVSEQSDADEMLVEKDWKVVRSARPGERGFGGRGKGAAFEPLYPPHLHFEKKR
jgi:hypothetical protein